MANSSRTIMTDAGFALETRVRADETKMQFTRAAISTDDHFSDTDDALAKLTELSNIQQDGKVTAVQVINTTTVYVQVDVNQAESKADYQMRSAALYAKDDDGTEVLYGVTVLQDPVFVHKDADGSYLGFGINTTVGRASNVVVVVDPANMVTQQVFESTMKNYYTKAEVDAKFVTDDDFASKLPKNIATTDAANTFAKSQTFAGGAADGAGNAIATTKDVSDGDATTLTSAKAYADTQVSSKADDSKVVHTADMRKPANDVAGIEEVNAKQDKIGYTPADDSKVVHTTVTQLTSTDMNTVLTAGFYSLNSGTNGMPNADAWTIYQVIPLSSFNGVQFAYGTNNDILGMRSWHNGNIFAGWVQFADDSKVAHLSGANNFDTVPTVNNNPLLLASSLPSDLARTGSNQEFTGKNTFDVAPIDKTTGNPYITAKAPGIPKLAVKYNTTSKAFDYTLTAPEKDGLSDIIQYNLLWKDHSVDGWTTVIVKPDALTGQLTGVDIAKTYDFKAAAQNAVGSSDSTDVITLGTAAVPGIPSLTVEYNAGKKGFDYTVTAPESDGGSKITGYSLEYQKQGVADWTKVALNPDSLTGTVTDGIEAGNDYLFRLNAENSVGSSDYFTVSDPLPTVDGNVYGVSWDGSSSGALQRTGAAVGLVAGINGAQNDFDTRGPWGLMDKTVTDSYGNAFVRVPKFYIRKTQNKPLSTWQVSLVKQGDDWYLPNCFYDFDNKKELNYVDVSRYEGFIESGRLKSKSGVNPTDNLDINHFRTSATALNVNGKKGYHLWDVHTLDALQVLFTIEFATLDSQSIMKGVTDSVLSGAESTGAADGVKGSSGNVNHSNGYGSMTYRGIENLYGNLSMWTDGLNISNLSLYSCDDATKYASDVFTSPYYKLNYSLHSINGNITGLGFDTEHPGVTEPTSSNNDSYNTYYHDDGYVNGSGNYVAYTGGSWHWHAGISGIWCWYGGGSSTGAYSDVGSRLLKKAL